MWAPPAVVGTAETVTMVANGTFDMAASWITINEERSEFVSFTYPYYDLGVAFVYRTTGAVEVRRRECWCCVRVSASDR